jgi:hypothetical protein
MIHELDMVALTRDLPEHNLVTGDVGAVVHCYSEGKAFEVEFVTAAGKTVAVVTLGTGDVRPLRGQEILHVRELALAA